MAKYKWGIESSSEEESGMIVRGTGCRHEHEYIYQAVDCLSANTRRMAPMGNFIANAIIARADGDRLDNTEADVLLWNLDRNGG